MQADARHAALDAHAGSEILNAHGSRRSAQKFNNQNIFSYGGPGPGEALAMDINGSDQRQDVPGPRPGERVRQLQGLLGSVDA